MSHDNNEGGREVGGNVSHEFRFLLHYENLSPYSCAFNDLSAYQRRLFGSEPFGFFKAEI